MSIKQNKQPLENEYISHTCGFWRVGGEAKGKGNRERVKDSLLSSSGEGLFQVTGVCIAHTNPTWRFTATVQKGAAASAYF